MTDVIKIAAEHLIETLKTSNGLKIGSSHAHASVAGLLGFNSKKALLVEYCDSVTEDDHILHREGASEKSLNDSISRMRNSPLKELPVSMISVIIEAGLTPACEQCGEKTLHSSPVFEGDSEDDPDGQVCDRCIRIREIEEEYATCNFCSSDIIHRSAQVNPEGECSVHQGEGYMDEEEREGWDSYIENITKDD